MSRWKPWESPLRKQRGNGKQYATKHVQRESNAKRIWYPKGEQPEVRMDQKKEGRSFYRALNVKTGKCYLLGYRQTKFTTYGAVLASA